MDGNSSFDVDGHEGSVSSGLEPDIERYSCSDCAYSTQKKNNLERHAKKHAEKTTAQITSTARKSNVKVCDQCARSFKTAYGLKLHVQNKHTKCFKYTCNICEKGYNQKTQYKCHAAQHLGIKMETCRGCGKGFSRKSTLKLHTETCHNPAASPTTCEECGSEFKSKNSLNEHIKGFHKNRTYSCKRCFRSFKWRSSLRAHMRIAKH